MISPTVERIAADMNQLPLSDQLALMEQLVQHIRERAVPTLSIDDQALVAMAADPAIQRELRSIATDFASTEIDGLDESL